VAVERHFSNLARKNADSASHNRASLGAGAYKTSCSATGVDHIIQRGEFLTAYTPYQPEIARGTLQMFNSRRRLRGCSAVMWRKCVDV
jgi:glycine dehydrogenase subunit 1